MSRTSSAAQQICTASYVVYSATVTTSPSESLRKGLYDMTKKDPPSKFEFELIYVSLPNSSVASHTHNGHSSPKCNTMQ